MARATTVPEPTPRIGPTQRRSQWLSAAGRGVALFLGLFTAANLLAGLRNPLLDMNLWWIDLGPLPVWIAQPFLAASAVGLLEYALGAGGRRLRTVSFWLAVGLGVAALANTVHYYRLLASGRLHAGPGVPFSLLVAGALLVILLSYRGARVGRLRWPARVLLGVVALACFVGFPSAQIWCFGLTDYRRPADAAVVFGARVYTSGRPSSALSDRVRTACTLYREGLTPLLIFSGGPGDGAVHETEAMRRIALAEGVPDHAIVLDRGGLSTHDTVEGTVRLFPTLRVRRVLAVSHFYHLPRIKMSYRRAGWEVFTVPVEHPREPAREFPFMVFRETAAMWAYYLRGG